MKTEKRASLLNESVKADDMEAVAKLLRRKSKLLGSRRKSHGNLQDDEGMSSLHQASLMGNLQILKMLMEIGVNLDQTDAKGMTPLHYASWHNTPDTASILLQRGAKVDIPDSSGNTPLHIACQHGQIDVINVLLYYRADPIVRNKVGLTPFDMACEYGRLKAVEVLLDSGLCKRLLFVHDELAKEPCKATPLHLAAKNGHNDVVRLLLESGCDINYKLRQGTPLHAAASSCRVETAKLLLYAGADVHATNAQGQNPLDVVKKVANKSDPSTLSMKQLLEDAQKAIYTKAICDYCAQSEDELSFNYGDVIWVINQTDDSKWKGVIFGAKYTSRTGYFHPSSVQLIDKKGMLRLVNQRQVKKVNVPSVPAFEESSHDSNQLSQTTDSNNDANIVNDEAAKRKGDTMKSSRSTFLSSSNKNAAAFNGPTMPNSASAFTFSNYQQQQQRMNTSFNNHTRPLDGSPFLSRGAMSQSPSQNRMSGSSTASSQTSSGFESMKNGIASHSLSNAAVHQLRSFNSPSRGSMHSNGSSSLGSLEKLDEFVCGSNGAGVNVPDMILNGVPEEEIMSIWLHNLRYEEYLPLFINAGYDVATLARMTPEDLTAIGITKPGHRKRLTSEIRKFNIVDSWPTHKPACVRDWLSALSLSQYVPWFEAQGYSKVENIMQLTWEDFEDIGVKKLGHLKKLMCALKKLKDAQQQHMNVGAARSSTPINVVNSKGGISEVLLINVPPTPRHMVGEITPYYHQSPSPQNHQLSSSMRTFLQNKLQSQTPWLAERNNVNVVVENSSRSSSPRSSAVNGGNQCHYNTRHSHDNLMATSRIDDDFAKYASPSERGCTTFWTDCGGSSSMDKQRLVPQHSLDSRTSHVRYAVSSDAIMHQPDRPKVVVKPCLVNNMTKSTSFAEYDKHKQHPNDFCRNNDYHAYIPQPERCNVAPYCYNDKQSTRYVNYNGCIREVSEPVEYYDHQTYDDRMPTQTIIDRLQPSNAMSTSMNSSIFQLSPQPCPDDSLELSPATSFDDFPPALRPLSCEEQIRNLHYIKSPADCRVIGVQQQYELQLQQQQQQQHQQQKQQQQQQPQRISYASPKLVAKVSHQSPYQDKHVTFALCSSPQRSNVVYSSPNVYSSSNDNLYPTPNVYSSIVSDQYYSSNDCLPFANENVGTIKEKSTSLNGQYTNQRKPVSEVFCNVPTTTIANEQPTDVLEDIGDMLQDLTDQLDALLIQRTLARNNCVL